MHFALKFRKTELISHLRELSQNYYKNAQKNCVILLKGNVFIVRGKLENRIREDLSIIEGVQYTNFEEFIIPGTFNSALGLLNFADKNNFWFGKEAGERLINILYLDIEGMTVSLLPYQKEGVLFALKNKQIILGDEMGLGKGIQTIAALQILGKLPALIVCPALLKSHWLSEFHEKLPGKTICVLQGGKPKNILDSDIVVINYDILENWVGILKKIPFGVIACDEAHYLKNIDSNRSKAVLEISQNIEYKFLLSGTPILNRILDLKGQLKILGKLDEFGGSKGFEYKYCGREDIYDRYGNFLFPEYHNPTNTSELFEKLKKDVLIHRTKAEVLPDLPAKRRTSISVNISNRAEYDKAQNDFLAYLEDFLFKDTKLSARISGLPENEQILEQAKAVKSGLENAKRAYSFSVINQFRQLAGRGKVKTIVKWAETFKVENQKLIIFFHHNDIGKDIARKLEAPIIYGEIPQDKRDVILRDFRNNPASSILIMNYEAGGLGIDLSVCTNVAFAEMDWSPAKMVQAEDRCHRMTSKFSVNVHYFVGENTIDQKMYKMQKEKMNIISQVMDGKEIEPIDVEFETIKWLLSTRKKKRD